MINKIFKYIKNDIKNNYKFYIVMLIITLMLVIGSLLCYIATIIILNFIPSLIKTETNLMIL